MPGPQDLEAMTQLLVEHSIHVKLPYDPELALKVFRVAEDSGLGRGAPTAALDAVELGAAELYELARRVAGEVDEAAGEALLAAAGLLARAFKALMLVDPEGYRLETDGVYAYLVAYARRAVSEEEVEREEAALQH